MNETKNLKIAGTNTSMCEVTNVTEKGLWLWVREKEYFISFFEYPALKKIPAEKIFDVKFIPPEHLCWEEFDIDIELSALEHPEKYPLLFKIE